MRVVGRGAWLAALFVLWLLPASAAADPASLVNPLSGSLGAGFPMVGASLPFGMIEPGPDTAFANGQQDPVNYDGYGYQDPAIRGFSLTHFDGAGVPIAGDVPFMPTTGAVTSNDPSSYSSPYAHTGEVAQPGYYAVTLRRYGIRAELAGTVRTALMRFTFPRTAQANVLAEVGQSINKVDPGSVSVSGSRTLEGWVRSDVGYRLYFVASFDRPFRSATIWKGSPAGATATFDTRADPTVLMRVGISYVDEAGAARNLRREQPAGTSFDAARRAARATWDRHLNDVAVAGGSGELQRTFYDNLYRSLLMPSIFDDVDGRYLGFDGRAHRLARGHHQYTALSLWDTYRTQTPLLELIEPRVARDVMASLLRDANQNKGVIPRWVQANIDRGIMGGDSGSATVADGLAQGFARPSSAALGALVAQATTLPSVWPREHLADYLRYGYVPNDLDGIGTSLTLEYAIDDQAIAAAARTLGRRSAAARLDARARYWRNLLDPSSGFLRPRNSNGSWANPTRLGDPSGVTGVTTPVSVPYSPNFQDGYQEGTGWQYLWSVPHDVAGLAAALGGRAKTLKRLDSFFSQALNHPSHPFVPAGQQYASFFGVYYVGDQYTPANEPDLWTPWYYDWLGQPWKAQAVARAEMNTYNSRPDGLPGNDDTGTMSAWYVLAALGIYHVTPGVATWELSAPAFPRMTLQVGARTFVISAPGVNSDRLYVRAAQLDGRGLRRTYLTTCELLAGGSLHFEVQTSEATSWGVRSSAAPPSQSAPSARAQRCAAALVRGGVRTSRPAHRRHHVSSA